MKWKEFRALLSGLNSETPLGRIVSIRAEEDKEILKYFSKEQLRIRNEWRNRKAKEITDINDVLEQLKRAFISMSK